MKTARIIILLKLVSAGKIVIRIQLIWVLFVLEVVKVKLRNHTFPNQSQILVLLFLTGCSYQQLYAIETVKKSEWLTVVLEHVLQIQNHVLQLF